jgi:hypothetical protein
MHIHYHVELVQDWTTNRDEVRNRLRHLYAVGGTALGRSNQAVVGAAHRVASSNSVHL